MVRCTRCGSGFSALHSAAEVSCPRCRIRDGVTSDFTPVASPTGRPLVLDPLAEMTRGLERGRAAIGVSQARTSA
jgi:hypothetical protein